MDFIVRIDGHYFTTNCANVRLLENEGTLQFHFEGENGAGVKAIIGNCAFVDSNNRIANYDFAPDTKISFTK